MSGGAGKGFLGYDFFVGDTEKRAIGLRKKIGESSMFADSLTVLLKPYAVRDGSMGCGDSDNLAFRQGRHWVAAIEHTIPGRLSVHSPRDMIFEGMLNIAKIWTAHRPFEPSHWEVEELAAQVWVVRELSPKMLADREAAQIASSIASASPIADSRPSKRL